MSRSKKIKHSNLEEEKELAKRKYRLKGIVLCKFDEIKGFIAVDKYPKKLFDKEPEILEKVAKNAIGMGEELEYTLFSISGTKCFAKRFYIESEEARGGKEIYALAIIADEIEDTEETKKKLSNAISRIKENWTNYKGELKSLYRKLKSPVKQSKQKIEDEKQINRFRLVKRPAFVEKIDRKFLELSESPLPTRGVIFVLGLALFTLSTAMGGISTVIFYATWGAVLFNLYARRDWPLYFTYILITIELTLVSFQSIASKLFRLTFNIALQLYPQKITLDFYVYLFLALLSGFLISMGILRGKSEQDIREINLPFRDLAIVITLCLVTYLIYIGYNLFTLTLMLTSSLLICSLITVREKLSKTCLTLIFIELLLLLLKVLNLPTVIVPEFFYPKFPESSEFHYATLSFLSGILIYLGLSKEKSVNKRGIFLFLLYVLLNIFLIFINYTVAF